MEGKEGEKDGVYMMKREVAMGGRRGMKIAVGHRS